MSGNAFKNLEESLKKHLPEAELKEVKRILYGRSDEWVSNPIFLMLFLGVKKTKIMSKYFHAESTVE